MRLPDMEHPAWKTLITTRVDYNFNFLATKFILGRLALDYQASPDEVTLKKCIEKLWMFFDKNKHLPQAKDDLTRIFGRQEDLL
jgi:hypothetical protein